MGWITLSDSSLTHSGSSSNRSRNSTRAYDWDKEEGGYIPYRNQAAHRERWRQEDRGQRIEERRERHEKRAERYEPVIQKKADFKAQIDALKERTRSNRYA